MLVQIPNALFASELLYQRRLSTSNGSLLRMPSMFVCSTGGRARRPRRVAVGSGERRR